MTSLSSCSVNLEEVEWDVLLDDLLVQAVDVLLENDGTSPGSPNKPGNTPPTAPTQSSISSTPYYYNDEDPHSSFLFHGLARSVISSGWELRGALLGQMVFDQETYDQASAEDSFTMTIPQFSNAGSKKDTYVDCLVYERVGNLIYFSYTNEAGEQINHSVDDWGRVFDANGEEYKVQKRFICLQITDNTRLVKADGEVFDNLLDTSGEGYTVEVTVAASHISVLQWLS